MLDEGQCIQNRLQNLPLGHYANSSARQFDKLMKLGKVKSALRLISREGKGNVLSPNSIQSTTDGPRSVLDILIAKHPPSTIPPADILLNGDNVNCLHTPIIFEAITGEVIRKATLHTQGAAGPSGLDAYAWRRLSTSFKGASSDLCDSLAAVTRRICSTNINPEGLSAFTASRLIPLDKSPGIRPVGIGEVARRIAAKTVLRLLSEDIRAATGPLQLCAGHIAGCEAAIHAVNEMFNQQTSDATLLVDASNPFNTINRQAALHNIEYICPSIATILNSNYNAPVKMFITGGGEIKSMEGTTQGDPLAMAMYALAITPLIQRLGTHIHQS